MVEKYLMKGVSADKFALNGALIDSMLMTILYRQEGQAAVSGASPFSDVAAAQWYDNAVIWANANKIVEGNGKFGPEDNITHEQMAAILYRYSQYKGYDVSKTADLSGYANASAISSWALPVMKWPMPGI